MPYNDVILTSTLGNWVTGFADLQVTDTKTSNLTMPNAYFVLGDLSKSPLYIVAGKKVVDFGKFNSPNTFVPTLTRAYFMSYGSQISVGYSRGGINATITLTNGLGENMLNSGASNGNHLNNFVVNTSYSGTSGKVTYYTGLGYINATGFSHTKNVIDSNTGVDKTNKMVSAVDLNGGITTKGFSINGEFLITTEGIKDVNTSSVYNSAEASNYDGTQGAVSDSVGYSAFGFKSVPALINFNSGSTVEALSLDSSYTVPVLGKDMVSYINYNQVIQSMDYNIHQIEVGARYNVMNTVWVGGSYKYLSGKSDGDLIGKFSTVMLDATAYF